jgi:hypothetical protein
MAWKCWMIWALQVGEGATARYLESSCLEWEGTS